MEQYHQHTIQAEFNQAIAARQAGLEGRARVCARRAAGLAALAYAQQNNLPAPSSAFAALAWLLQQPNLPGELIQALQTLLTRVDTNFSLPSAQDPLAAASKIIQQLLKIQPLETPMTENTTIILYGTQWCGDTRRARSVLDQNGIVYQWIDIDLDLEARSFVEKTNHGFRSVPTIVFPDGTILVEPSELKLKQKLGLV